MATSGSVESSSSAYLKIVFDWAVTYDTTNMLAHWTVSATVKRTNTGSFGKNFATVLHGNPDYIYFNNDMVWQMYEGYYNGSHSSPYAYTGDNSVCADKKSTSKYTSGELTNKYPYGLSHLLIDYTFDTPIDADGNTSLTISSQLTGGYSGNISSYTGTIIPDQVEVASKIYTKVNGSWTPGARIWHKENGTWVRRNLYRRENGAWVKK